MIYTSLLCIVIIILFLLIYTKKKIERTDPFMYENRPKISVFIMNFERPHNLEISLPLLSHYPDLIGEIIVCNTHPLNAIQPIANQERLGKIQIIIYNDFEPNNRYGAARRDYG